MMQEHYYLDLEKLSLQKFQLSLQKRALIPSWTILKEHLEERFKQLEAWGLKNLKDVVNVLKTKCKIDQFSKESGLPLNYLTILKREVSAYHPNPVNLKNFPGIDAQILETLERLGIKNSRQLFTEAKRERGIHHLSQTTGISLEHLDELVSLSDLVRLYGVGPVFARMIYDAGVRSVHDVVRYSAEEFIMLYEKASGKKADFSIHEIHFSLEFARELLSMPAV